MTNYEIEVGKVEAERKAQMEHAWKNGASDQELIDIDAKFQAIKAEMFKDAMAALVK